MLPQQRTADVLKDIGFVGGNVEQTIRLSGGRVFKRDLMGCIDQVYVRGDVTLAIQSTTRSNAAARTAKSVEEPRLRRWLDGGGRSFEVWGWRKITRNLPRPKWVPQITRVSLRDGALVVEVDVVSVAIARETPVL